MSNTVPPPPPWRTDARAAVAAPEPDEFLLEAMREVDALTPSCPPIAPQGYRGRVDLSRLVPPPLPRVGIDIPDIFERIKK